MNWKQLIKKEREVWHDRFIPSLIAAGAVLIITFILQLSGFDIVLLTSISASIVILTSKEWHRLTVAGTTIYAYIVATVIGFIFLTIEQNFNLSVVVISFLTICTITLAIYMLNIFHPPAVGIALGIVLYKGTALSLVLVLVITILMFIIVKFFMYMYYKHLKFSQFHHEFLIWEKKWFKE
tara:strand:+ start:241 stop:783 length:543 start_codon:yes stop_codon:yes gene_type:complete